MVSPVMTEIQWVLLLVCKICVPKFLINKCNYRPINIIKLPYDYDMYCLHYSVIIFIWWVHAWLDLTKEKVLTIHNFCSHWQTSCSSSGWGDMAPFTGFWEMALCVHSSWLLQRLHLFTARKGVLSAKCLSTFSHWPDEGSSCLYLSNSSWVMTCTFGSRSPHTFAWWLLIPQQKQQKQGAGYTVDEVACSYSLSILLSIISSTLSMNWSLGSIHSITWAQQLEKKSCNPIKSLTEWLMKKSARIMVSTV